MEKISITNEATMTQRVALRGMQTERDNADRHMSPSRGVEQHKIEFMVIPIESIMSIKYSTEVKKGNTKIKTIRLQRLPSSVELTCCQF
jgi:hypothetical protein